MFSSKAAKRRSPQAGTRVESLEHRHLMCGPHEIVDSTGSDICNHPNLDLVAPAMPIYDYGDAPDAYHTRHENDGAVHVVNPDVSLGENLDAERNGKPSRWATGDDRHGGLIADDEDGVRFFSMLGPGTSAQVEVTVNGDGYLNAWVDFYRDGDFNDSVDQIFAGLSLGTGTHLLTFDVPADAQPSLLNTIARFRFSSTHEILEAHGGVPGENTIPDGEVEDHAVWIRHGEGSGDHHRDSSRIPFNPFDLNSQSLLWDDTDVVHAKAASDHEVPARSYSYKLKDVMITSLARSAQRNSNRQASPIEDLDPLGTCEESGSGDIIIFRDRNGEIEGTSETHGVHAGAEDSECRALAIGLLMKYDDGFVA